MPGFITWTELIHPPEILHLAELMNARIKLGHWSRVYEYPWCYMAGLFEPGMKVLDAGGGDCGFQYHLRDVGCLVTNVDHDPAVLPPPESRITSVVGDLANIPFPDNTFDRSVCISVAEHTPDPIKVISELQRVTKKGGRVIVTLDVANYYRWNHTVDLGVAGDIAHVLGLQIPPFASDMAGAFFNEQDPQPGEPTQYWLVVLCICSIKV